jgi:hypothetical protein
VIAFSIFRDRQRTVQYDKHTLPVDKHVLKIAYRRRPAAFCLLLGGFALSPLLLAYLLPSVDRQTSAAYWLSVLVGELFVAAIVAWVWFKGRN